MVGSSVALEVVLGVTSFVMEEVSTVLVGQAVAVLTRCFLRAILTQMMMLWNYWKEMRPYIDDTICLVQ